MNPRLNVRIGQMKLRNPVMTASGTFGYGLEYAGLVDLSCLGAIVVKGLSLSPSPGNPPPRIAETACGMLNAIGLENIGVQAFIRDKLPYLKDFGTPVVANLYGTEIEAYARLAAILNDTEAVEAVELNISCPNVKAGGVAFGIDPAAAAKVVRTVRPCFNRTLIVKLSPNVSDIAAIARAVEAEGADAVSLINTLTGMVVDLERRRPLLANVTGGLSGPAIKPVALRMVWQVAQAVRIPVIGMGGIMTARDALEFLLVGATAIQVGTANFVKPDSTMHIVDGIGDYLAQAGIADINQFIGTLET